jgi:hypothetical protein
MYMVLYVKSNTLNSIRYLIGSQCNVLKESQSTKMHCALKCFHCFVFCHFVSQFINEILTSETYPYQFALFLDDVIFSIVGIC